MARIFSTNKSTVVIHVVSGLLLGWFIHIAYASWSEKVVPLLPVQNTSNNQVRVNLPQYSLIAPPLYSETAKSNNPTFKILENKVADFVASTTAGKQADSVSVYFRDLNTAQWTGVNEDQSYRPSSMLKVIAMMAALKLAEQDPSILQEKLPLVVSESSGLQYFKPNDHVISGKYQVQDLIALMIKYSDNDALDALLSDTRINDEFGQIYTFFRLPVATATSTDYMSPRSYAGLFISLYNSTLFQWGLSQQVLGLLADTTFKQGLVAGIPDGVVVAHKFGENTDIDATTDAQVNKELHDCGIVYVPKKPYLLCVMTRGQDFAALSNVISGISKLVYNQVTASSIKP